ncbi:MAG: hypothetical protein COR54_11920 [Elusimicrobia bacterium CG22_combo_CG10-13_8_21_14_all_63_91]|nr:MAG: hypothetical protein COR54_11920 [Elusimicrobia bacterium CG22_combo_CG10-13_8_21_14_all_63_91]
MENKTLNYDALVAEYQDNLTSKLRGFGSSCDFLELWVHDEDDDLSLAGMIESAKASGVSLFSLTMSGGTAGRVDFDRVRKIVEGFATLAVAEEADGTRIEVSIR